MQELNGFKDSVNKYSMINDKYEDMNILWQMGMEDQDESVYAEVSDNLKELTQLIESFRLISSSLMPLLQVVLQFVG